MANRDFGIAAILAIVAIAMMFFSVCTSKAFAADKTDDEVQRTLVERTEGFCNAVLPNWFASDAGVDDPHVRSVITDCFMGHARLAVLGAKSNFPLSETNLSEVPATLLHEKADINLDIYRPLAGRILKTRSAVK
jgi:hypothetical protein